MNPVLRFLNFKVIPWLEANERPRLVVARPVMKKADMPFGASISDRPLAGSRTAIRNRRNHANMRTFTANWLEDNQQEMALPKLACVVEGSADYLLGDYCAHANEGTFILIPPRMPHHRRGPFLDNGGGTCTILFAYAYSHGVLLWFSRSQGATHVNDMGNRHLIPSAAAAQVFHLLTEEAASTGNHSQTLHKNLLSALYTLLTRDIEAGRYTNSHPNEHVEASVLSDADFSGQVTEYIQANLAKHIKIEDIAGQLYMSESHFSRTLRRKMDVSFVELLTRHRIERAKSLLQETDWTVHAISGFTGYKSSTYFHDLFRLHVGCSPLEYRRKHRSAK